MRLVRIGVAIAAMAVAGVAAHAQPVSWSGPDECPAEPDVIAEIERLLGGDVDWGAWDALGAEIVATPADGGWRVVITTREPPGVRELRGATCAEVADAAALVVAMTIDPDKALATAAEPEPEPDDASSRTETTESAGDSEIPVPIDTATTTTTTSARPRRRIPLRWGIRADIVSDLGALPGVKPGAGITAAAMLGRWRLELSGTYWFQRREPLDEAPDAGGDLSLLAGAVRGCYRVLGIDGCGGFELGRFSARGFGTDEPRSDSATWLAPTAGIEKEIKVSKWFSFYVLAEAGLPLRRPRFTVTGVTGPDEKSLVHQPAPVVARFLVGGEIRLP